MKVRAPGRICLFGEHQDYLGFPIIAAAIDRYIFVDDSEISDPVFDISMPDINRELILPTNSESDLSYDSKRDYIKSSYNVLRRMGCLWSQNSGFKVRITGNIPINAGASSSSAMTIAMLKYFSLRGSLDLNPEKIAELGYFAEVAEFGEAGGMMDHFASSLGGIIFMETAPKFKPTKIDNYEENFHESFILINSEQKKDTVEDLRRVKSSALSSFDEITNYIPNFDKYTTAYQEIDKHINELDYDLQRVLRGNIKNRDLTQDAIKILKDSESRLLSTSEKERFGQLIFEHHKQLSENVGVSTEKIDNIIELCMDNGAYGGKINGSGFGGTLFVYCPSNRDQIIEILKEKGIKYYPIEIAKGAEQY